MLPKKLGKSDSKPSELRQLLPALQNKVYLNYGGQGPLPSPSLQAIISSWGKIQELGPFTNNVWPYIANEIQTTKKYLADLCGVSINRLALTENVTSGCVLPLWGLPLNKKERILISDCEHPGVVAACRELARRKGLAIDILQVQKLRQGSINEDINDELVLKELEQSLKPNTSLVVISHLLWNTGQIMPIFRISKQLKQHSLRPFLLVDAAQSFGQIPIKEAAANSDIYAFTGHKWALGPEGLGGVALSERVLSESNPTFIGWKSLQKEGSIYINDPNPFHSDGRRFEIATSCIPLLAGLRCSLDLLSREGSVKNRHEKIKNLSSKLWTGLNQIEGIRTVSQSPPPSGLVSFSLVSSKEEHSIVKLLGIENTWIRVLEDPSWLRACLHVTSQEQEIDTLLNSLQSLPIQNIIFQ